MKNNNVGRPSYVPEEMWNGLVEHWNKPTVKAKSEAARRARFAEPNGPGTGYVRHYGGSVSVAVIAQKIVSVIYTSIKLMVYTNVCFIVF